MLKGVERTRSYTHSSDFSASNPPLATTANMSERVCHKILRPRQIIGVNLLPNVGETIKAEAFRLYLSLSQLPLRRGEVTSQQ